MRWKIMAVLGRPSALPGLLDEVKRSSSSSAYITFSENRATASRLLAFRA